MIKYALVIAMFLGFLSACQKVERLEKMPIKVDKLNVLCMTRAGDSFVVIVYNALSALDNASPKKQKKATVKLYKDGSFLEQLLLDPVSLNYISKNRAEKLAEYRLEVSVSGYQMATASTTIIDTLHWRNAVFTHKGKFTDTSGGKYFVTPEISFEIQKEPLVGGAKMYLFEFWSDTQWRYYSSWVSTNTLLQKYVEDEDTKFQPLGGGFSHVGRGWYGYGYDQAAFVFENPEMKSGWYQANLKEDGLSMRYSTSWHSIQSIDLEFITFSTAAYQHVQSTVMAYKRFGESGIFANPVQISSNIQNGYGIFGSYANTTINLPVKW